MRPTLVCGGTTASVVAAQPNPELVDLATVPAGEGGYRLFLVPLNKYRKDRKIVKGMQQTNSFLTNFLFSNKEFLPPSLFVAGAVVDAQTLENVHFLVASRRSCGAAYVTNLPYTTSVDKTKYIYFLVRETRVTVLHFLS